MSKPNSSDLFDNRRRSGKFNLVVSLFLFLTVSWFTWPLLTNEMGSPIEGQAASQNHLEATATPFLIAPTATISPLPSPTLEPTPDLAAEIIANANDQFILSMSENGLNHLYLFDHTSFELRRISQGGWHDEAPQLHPSGLKMAFSSNDTGNWEIKAMNLIDGSIATSLIDGQYVSNPSWSGDGSWIAYESYVNGNLDIYIRELDGSSESLRLTTHDAVDHNPSWSPTANRIAFASERNGTNRIWLLDIDDEDGDRIHMLLPNQVSEQIDPAWSPNGQYLAWSAFVDGYWRIFILDIEGEDARPIEIGLGKQATWSPDSTHIAAIAEGVTESFLLAYDLNGQLVFPAKSLPGRISGIAWGASFADQLPELIDQITENTGLDWTADADNANLELVSVSSVTVEYPRLIGPAQVSFTALRDTLGEQLGWDVLSHLDTLYLPLNIPADPRLAEDWSYTGRSMKLLESLVWTDWMRLALETINGQDYWRIYLRPVDEQSQWGRAIVSTHNLVTYDGQQDASVDGLWIDATQMFADFGWQRMAALGNWEEYFPGMRFTQFIFSQENNWQQAMSQIYPSSKLKEFLEN